MSPFVKKETKYFIKINSDKKPNCTCSVIYYLLNCLLSNDIYLDRKVTYGTNINDYDTITCTMNLPNYK